MATKLQQPAWHKHVCTGFSHSLSLSLTLSASVKVGAMYNVNRRRKRESERKRGQVADDSTAQACPHNRCSGWRWWRPLIGHSIWWCPRGADIFSFPNRTGQILCPIWIKETGGKGDSDWVWVASCPFGMFPFCSPDWPTFWNNKLVDESGFWVTSPGTYLEPLTFFTKLYCTL